MFRSASVFGITVCDYDRGCVLLESVKTETENDEVLRYYKKHYLSRMEAVRGGAVAPAETGEAADEASGEALKEAAAPEANEPATAPGKPPEAAELPGQATDEAPAET